MSWVPPFCKLMNFSLKCEYMSSSGTAGDIFLSFISQFIANLAKVQQKVQQVKRPLKFSFFFNETFCFTPSMWYQNKH